jgi:hypothetical protein
LIANPAGDPLSHLACGDRDLRVEAPFAQPFLVAAALVRNTERYRADEYPLRFGQACYGPGFAANI